MLRPIRMSSHGKNCVLKRREVENAAYRFLPFMRYNESKKPF